MSVDVQRTRRRQQREETRRQILDAAQQFLRERSYRELSVDVLMTQTGHTRTVFYRHFEDIPSLLLTLMAEIGADLVQLGELWANVTDPDPEKARAHLGALVDFYVRNGPLIRAVVEASHHDAEVEAAYNGMVDGFIALATASMRRRVADGSLDIPDPEQVARAIVRMLNAYLNDVLCQDPPVDAERVLDAIALIWTRTLLPRTTA